MRFNAGKSISPWFLGQIVPRLGCCPVPRWGGGEAWQDEQIGDTARLV